MSSPTSAPAGARWFALHTLSGQEGKVKTYIEKFKKAEELDDFIFEVLLPTEVVSEVKGGKKSTKVRKLYPGYVFIQARLFDEEGKLINKPWYFVKETTGVIGFVGGGRRGQIGRLAGVFTNFAALPDVREQGVTRDAGRGHGARDRADLVRCGLDAYDLTVKSGRRGSHSRRCSSVSSASPCTTSVRVAS